MREIKFRCFNKDNGLIGLVYRLDFNNGLVEVETEEETTHTFGLSYVELMQYTGLKDKNGKEIYEGDVLCCYEGDDAYHLVGEVYFGTGSYSLKITRKLYCVTKRNNDLSTKPIKNTTYRDGARFAIDEVIGNIYENPELLEAEDGKTNS